MSNQALSKTLRVLFAGIKFKVLGDLRAANLDLNPPDISLLEQLAEQPGLSPQALAVINNCDKALITRRVRKLESCALITRKPDPNDQRSVRLSLTQEGVRVSQQALNIFTVAQEQAFAPLSAEEQETLLALLSKCLPMDKRL